MSINTCPYDGNHCQKMESRFDAWQKVVLQNDGVIFPIKPDVFSDCPISNTQERRDICERFSGCLTAVNNAAAIRQELGKAIQNEQR